MPAQNELKILSDNGTSFKIGGYGVVFGGQDLTGDQFTANTDFWMDRITENPPVLYQHGLDTTLKRTVVGRVTTTKIDDVGLWVEAQITAAKQYGDAIRQLIARGVLGWSSSSVPHLVQRVKSTMAGVTEITSWPIVEISLTPSPAEPRTVGIQELKALAALDPLLSEIAEEAVKAELTSRGRNNLSNSDFAYVDSDGGTHLPIHDEAHIRNAMSRFGQTHFESPEKKKTAARKIMARARSHNIDVADDSAVAMAAKGVVISKATDLQRSTATVDLNALPDSAFAYIEPGGMLDDEKKTFPRTSRLFAHHSLDGSVDINLLEAAIRETETSEHGAKVFPHLKRHAIAAGFEFWPHDGSDDAHTSNWSEGVAPALMVLASKMVTLAEDVAADRQAMTRLGLDTKAGERLNLGMRNRLKALNTTLGQILEQAESIERGEDGTAQVDLYRYAFDLLTLEEVA